MNSTIIRKLRAEDEPRWRVLWAGYVRFYRGNVSPEVTASVWQKILDDTGDTRGLIAERNGEVIGLVHYVYHAYSGVQQRRTFTVRHGDTTLILHRVSKRAELIVLTQSHSCRIPLSRNTEYDDGYERDQNIISTKTIGTANPRRVSGRSHRRCARL
jgi:hypothetical protein